MTYEPNNIYLADCYEAIKQLPDKSVDLIVTDPPYLMETRGAGFHKKRDYYDEIHNDGLAVGIKQDLLCEFERVMKKTNIYIFCNKNLLPLLFQFYKDKNFDLLIWHKSNPIPTINQKYLSDIEYVFFARDKGVEMYNDYSTSSKVYTSVVNKADKEKFEHQTIKPLPLVQRLITNSSQPNDIVLDPFIGSGTTAVACKNLGRQYIGFEINPKWHKIAVDRLNNIQANGQMSFFTE